MKRVLVLSGGGSKGAYEVGALKYLINEQGREYDAICGISVGALNGSFLAQYKKSDIKEGIKDLEAFWLKIKTKDIYKKWFMWPITVPWKPSVYNSRPLQDLIHENLDNEKLRKSGVELNVGAVNLKYGHILYRNQGARDIKDFIAASSAFPLMLSPVRVRESFWVDGGVRDVTPLGIAIQSLKADQIDVIVAQDKFTMNRTKKPNVIRDAGFVLSVLMNEVIENDLNKAHLYNTVVKRYGHFDKKRIVDITTIRPNGGLNHSSLKFEKDLFIKDMELGYNDAKQLFEGKDGL